MILKNKALQIFDFLALPSEKLYERAARFQFEGLLEVVNGKAPYEGEKVFALSYFPEIAAALGEQAMRNAGVTAAMKAQPMSALYLLIRNYGGYAQYLEPIVLTSPEATYYLLKYSRDQKFALREKPEVYWRALLSEPFWALRCWGDTQEDAILSMTLQAAEANKDKLAGAAYVHLYFNTEADPTDFVETLSSSPMVAYLSSRHFYDRGVEFQYFNLRGLTPRWAYHFITDGFLDNEEGLVDTMINSPDWLVEYLVESERYKDLAYTGKVVERALETKVSNPQLTYLKLWWARVQEYVKKLPPPKTPKTATNGTANAATNGTGSATGETKPSA